MRKSHIIFISLCVGFVILIPLTGDFEYIEKYGYYSSMGEASVLLIPAGISYYIYLKYDSRKKYSKSNSLRSTQ